jgi:hypothetical protein
MRHWLSIPGCICHSPASALDCYDVGMHKALAVSHATARTPLCHLGAPEVKRGNRYSALRMTAKVELRMGAVA